MENKLDYISRKLTEIEIAKRLPNDGVESEPLINTANDVISAIFIYLAVNIRHEATILGVFGT